jgi:RNA polymerase sigma factor (sigma-70 family)
MVQEPRVASALRRLTPQVEFPPVEFFALLGEFEGRLLRRRLSESAECVLDGSFVQPDAEHRIMNGCVFHESNPESPSDSTPLNDDSGCDLLSDGDLAASPSARERGLFLQFNYCRYRVMRVLKEAKGKALAPDQARELIRWEATVRALRGEIVRMNVPLVLAMAKRTKITAVDPADMISEGNLALLRSVDKFDCNRGFKFSTYACRAILKSFSRVASRTARHRGYFPTEFDPTLEKSDHVEQKRRGLEDDCVTELKQILDRNLARLNDIEQTVIKARFAIDDTEAQETEPARAKTLEQVGEMIGVTKERVRQIQNKALVKLRLVLEEAVLPA